MKKEELLSVDSQGFADLGPDIILTFRLADQLYALPVTAVVQIVEMVAITRLPQLPPAMQGAINVHGRIVPVMDLRRRFGLECQPYHLHTPIILAEVNGCMLALVVDAVEDVVEMPPSGRPDAAEAPPLAADQNNFVTAVIQIESQLVPLIDLAHILSQNEKERLKHVGREFSRRQQDGTPA